MAYDLGTAFIQIVPSFEHIDRELEKGAKDLAAKVGAAAEKAIPQAFVDAVREGSRRSEGEASKAGRRSAKAFGDHFETTLKQRMAAAFQALPEVEITADSTSFDRSLASIRNRLERLREQEVKVGVNDAEILRRVRRLREDLRRLEENAPTIQVKLDAAAARAEAEAFLAGIDARAGAFARRLSQELKAAIAALPAADIDIDVDPAAQKLQALRRELERLSELQVGVNITEEKALQRLAAVREALARIADESDSVELRVNADQAMTVIDRFYDSMVTSAEKAARDAATAQEKEEAAADKRREQRESARRERDAERAVRDAQRAAERAARAAEEAFGRTFAGKVAKQLQSALDSLPDFDLAVNPSPAMLAIAVVRDNLRDLSQHTVGVDIDEAEAMRRIAEIKAALVELAANDPSIQVHVDAAAAAAELAAIETLATRLDGDRIGIDVKASGRSEVDAIGESARVSLSHLEKLIFGSLSLGTVLVPTAAAAAAAVGFIGTAAAASGAAIGAMVLGFGGIGDAVKAMQQLQDDSGKSQASFARSVQQQESAIAAMTAAERSLANVRANNAEAARRAARAVADAERAIGDARRDAAEAVQAAIERQADAERDLERAHVDVREAREALTEAYKDALDAYADLDAAVKRNSLNQRQAALDVKEAKEELDKFLLNPRATEEEREQARVTYELRLLQMQELQREGKQLADEQAENDRKGVEGSDQVVRARERIADAEQRVSDAQRAVARAHEAVLKAQLEGARRVSDAETRLADARHAQQEQARRAAFSLAQANESIATAARQAERAQTRAGIAGGDAYDNLNEALSKLSPTAAAFAGFIFRLGDDFRRLRASAADNLLPGVQQSIETLLPYLPAFSRWLGEVAGAVGDMWAATTRFLTTDGTWRQFFAFIGEEGVPTLHELYLIGRNVATGLVGLIMALSPFNRDIGGGLVALTERFAKWAATLRTNASFERFLGYIQENGPRVVDLIGELVTFVGRFIVAAAPVGELVLRGFVAFTEALNSIPISVLTTIVFALGTFAAAVLLVSGTQRAFGLVQGTVNAVVARGTAVFGALGVAVGTTRAQMAAAHATTGQFGTALRAVNASAGLARRGLGALVGFLGGPVGAAVTAATLLVGGLVAATIEYRSKVETLKVALGQLGEAYDEATRSGKAAAQGTRDALAGIVATNPDLQEAVVTLRELGVSFDDFSAAATGSASDMDAILAVLDREIDVVGDKWRKQFFTDPIEAATTTSDRLKRLRQLRAAIIENADAMRTAQTAQDAMNSSQNRANNLSKIFGTVAGPVSIDVYRQLAAQYDANAARIQVLTNLTDVFANKQSTAAERADALRAAIEQETSAAIDAVEAAENLRRKTIDLAEAVRSNGTTSLNMNTAAGLRNRDALEAAAEAVRERYLADVESGKPMKEATRLHDERIKALIEEARRLGLDEKAARSLIKTYGEIPEDIKTVYSTKGFDKIYKELQELQFAQYALSQGMTPAAAWTAWQEKQNDYRKKRQRTGGHLEFSGDGYGLGGGPGVQAQFYSTGGRVWGAGTSTSDSNLAWLSNREFVQPASAVDYYGEGLMEAIRHKLLPKGLLPGFATGGINMPMRLSLANTRIPAMDEVREAVLSRLGTGAPSSGGIGSADMMRLLRVVFPGLPMYSGFRPGSRTSSGNLSYHAMAAADGDKGRAVDIPPRQDVFNWIHDNFFRATRELIWGGDPSRNIHNGRYHRYSESLLRAHGPYRGVPGVSPHIHWAYDAGGFLPPGVSTVFNGTGRPEPVLTDAQWADIRVLVERAQSQPGGETHHWHFARADLDIPRLTAWANAREARARAGRPN
ncbi:hypothetical protein KBX50_05170 [Micromonospora sp. C51]|uniref:hypothetical protein n=1 Tax=Micromonospora sp. C51 TaxID=2824879 RepID=UPI001B39792F|nr:hypothetical protein [Micromonospora sp. C51]MBQ1047849.1 hypothetical protein [Micromonospora sp. C51]